MPAHIRASKGDIAERVIVVGDPERARQISKMLEECRLVNDNRGLLVYTGKYKGTPITVATHGIGAPSAAIVFEELRMLGGKVMVRLGTCGGFLEEMNIGDIIVVTGAAYPIGGTIGMYIKGEPVALAAVPSYDIVQALIEECKIRKVKYFVGPVFSSDAFYAEDPEFIEKWKSRGYLAVEMECATLFTLGLLRGFKTGALLIVSNNLAREEKEVKIASELREYVRVASSIVLEALVKVEV